MQLDDALKIYYHSMHKKHWFTSLKGISIISRLMMEKEKHSSYPIAYKLLKLLLVLPIVMVIVEIFFFHD